MTLEPTEAMVEAAASQLSGHEGNLRFVLEAAIAAAPPEWLLRAALSEREIRSLHHLCVGVHTNPHGWSLTFQQNTDDARDKLSRALRGGEETKQDMAGPPYNDGSTP